jgi:hypothetical protein
VDRSAVEVLGLYQTKSLLAKFEPDLLKRLDRTVNLVARDLRRGAQANFQRTGAAGDAYAIRRRNRPGGFSVAVTTARGSVSPGERWSSEPGVLARIFELANKTYDSQPQNVRRTQSLIETLTRRYGKPGRFLWDAWDERKATSLARVSDEVRAVESEYAARMK